MHQERHGDALPGADQHVVLTGRLGGADRIGQVDEVVGRLAHGADHGHHVAALAAGAGDVVGHGTDPVGVADRGAPELLDDQWHPDKATDCAPAARPRGARPSAGLPRRPPTGGRSGAAARDWVGSRAVPSEKRARQRAAREARLAAEAQQQKRRKQIRNGIIVVVIAADHRRHRLPGLGQRATTRSPPSRAGARRPRRPPRPRAPTPRRRPRPTRWRSRPAARRAQDAHASRQPEVHGRAGHDASTRPSSTRPRSRPRPGRSTSRSTPRPPPRP